MLCEDGRCTPAVISYCSGAGYQYGRIRSSLVMAAIGEGAVSQMTEFPRESTDSGRCAQYGGVATCIVLGCASREKVD